MAGVVPQPKKRDPPLSTHSARHRRADPLRTEVGPSRRSGPERSPGSAATGSRSSTLRTVPADRLRVSGSCVIGLDELEWRFSGSGGPGGQHANTANTRVELRFDVGGVAARSGPASGPGSSSSSGRSSGWWPRTRARSTATGSSRSSGSGTAWPRRCGSSGPGSRPGSSGRPRSGGCRTSATQSERKRGRSRPARRSRRRWTSVRRRRAVRGRRGAGRASSSTRRCGRSSCPRGVVVRLTRMRERRGARRVRAAAPLREDLRGPRPGHGAVRPDRDVRPRGPLARRWCSPASRCIFVAVEGVGWKEAFIQSGSSLFTLGFEPPVGFWAATLGFVEAAHRARAARPAHRVPADDLRRVLAARGARRAHVGARRHAAAARSTSSAARTSSGRLDNLDDVWVEWQLWFAELAGDAHVAARS